MPRTNRDEVISRFDESLPGKSGSSTEIAMWKFDGQKVPHLKMPLPGPKAKQLLERDSVYVSPSYTRGYPLVVAQGSGAVIEDVETYF
jgi:4-aminobutyrate aminotransferase